MPSYKFSIMPFISLILALLCVASYETIASAEESYSWPSFQKGLKPGLSASSVKAKLPESINLTSAEPGTPKAQAAYSGVWEGWMCPKAAVDVKVAITNVTAAGASIIYASAAESWRANYAGGAFNRSASASFKGDTLQSRLERGVNLILGMRSDGHLNVKWELSAKGRMCTGVLQKRNVGQAGSGGKPLPASVPLPEDLRITQPASNIPPGTAKFVGKWGGVLRNGRDIVVVVESVDDDGDAKVIYALSKNKRFDAFYVRSEGTIENDVLRFSIRGGAKLEYRTLDENRMTGTWSRGGKSNDMDLERLN